MYQSQHPSSAPLLINAPFEAYYPVESISFSINSVDYTSLIQLPSIYVKELPALGDTFGVFSSFLPRLDIGAGPDVYLFCGFLSGPTSTISSLTLPASLDFLSLVTANQSAFDSPPPTFEAFGGGTFTVTAPAAVPEPGTLLSLGCGLLGLAYRIRRAGVGNKITLRSVCCRELIMSPRERNRNVP
jgi:PEP-CTERM motif